MAAALAAVPAIASAQAAAPTEAALAPQATVAAPAPNPLAQIPGVTVRHYDVTGNTIEAIRASIAAQRPKDPATGNPTASSSNWSIGVGVKKTTTGTQCKLTGATATFKGEVVLPRLVGIETLPAPVQTQWRNYVASIEQQQADRLRQPFQRLGEVERAVMASSCDGAGEAANKAIAEITRAAPVAPAAAAPAPAPAPANPTQR
jgi:predicted secreted Zn-dependent protease